MFFFVFILIDPHHGMARLWSLNKFVSFAHVYVNPKHSNLFRFLQGSIYVIVILLGLIQEIICKNILGLHNFFEEG